MILRNGYFVFILFIFFIIAGCAGKSGKMLPQSQPLSSVNTSQIDFVDDLDIKSLDLAIERSLSYYDDLGDDKVCQLADRKISVSRLRESLIEFRRVIKNEDSLEERKRRINRDFDVYRAAGQDGYGSVLFTGYYVPQLAGSRTRTKKYKYPLYKAPPELLSKNNSKAAPYFSRREIDIGGVLRGKNLEIAWVADPVELFFLHIQGSGEIKFEDDTILTVSTLFTNGRPYRSVPAYLLKKGVIGRDASNRNVKRFLKEKDEDALFEILSYNERYIFFKLVEKPTGALGKPVTAGRTIATDPEMFPPGALAFIRLSKPALDNEGNPTAKRIPFSRFVLNQDKGAAIKGPGRVDLFCGFGNSAESTAANLKEKGELYFLIKK
ncbi:MAG: MltA domain-containing protein [Smithella sp.]